MRSHIPHSGFLLLTALAKPATMPKQLMRITVSGVMRSHVHCTPQARRQQPPQPTGPPTPTKTPAPTPAGTATPTPSTTSTPSPTTAALSCHDRSTGFYCAPDPDSHSCHRRAQSTRDPACNLGHKEGSTYNRDINRIGPVASP
jgi:hypothetical protein